MSSGERRAGSYIRANDLDIYYDEDGQGKPLVLLHGGTLTAASWQPYLGALAEHFRVIMPDSRGHGRTKNPAGTLSYQLMADDVAGLVLALGLEKPFICGYSDGGQIALELGMRHPGLCQALVVGGACFKFSESYRAWLRAILGDEQSPEVDLAEFERIFPDWTMRLQQMHGIEAWKQLLGQIKPMWATPWNYTADDFARVTAPTLVLLGDRDQLVPVEEATEMYRLLPDAELLVVPDADHSAFFSAKVAVYQSLILDFLARHSEVPGPHGPPVVE